MQFTEGDLQSLDWTSGLDLWNDLINEWHKMCTKASSKWLFTYLTLKLAAKPDQVQAICVHATMDRSKVICTLTET